MSGQYPEMEALPDVPAERELPPGRHDLHRENLMNHILSEKSRPAARQGAHPGPVWRPTGRKLAAVTAGAAVAAGVTGYALGAGSAPATRPAAAPSAAGSASAAHHAAHHGTPAAQLLDDAARRVASAAASAEPSPGQRISTKTAGYGYPGLYSVPAVDEEWTTFDGGRDAYQNGPGGPLVVHTSPVAPPGPGVSPWAAWNADVTPKTAYDVLASLPADPQALRAVIAAHAAGQSSADLAAGDPVASQPPKSEAQREFDYLGWLLWNAAAGVGGPPSAEAAAYHAMATLPGISVQQGITDVAGGQAIGVSDDGGYSQLLIDPVSYQVIGISLRSDGVSGVHGAIPVGLSKAQREKLEGLRAAPARGTLLEEIVYAQVSAVSGPGVR